MSWTPRLRTVLLIVNVVILAMPLGAIAALRIYDSELVRQTEAELIAQGAFVDATFRGAFLDELERRGESPSDFGHAPVAEIEKVDGRLIPVAPQLDVNAARMRPPAPDPVEGERRPVEPSLDAGTAISKILSEAQRITFAGIRVVDENGTIVASTADDEQGLSIATHEEVGRALEGEFVSLLRERISDSPRPPIESISRRTTLRVFVAMPVLVDDRVVGAVVLSRTPMSIVKALYQNRFVFLAMLLTLLVGVGLITILTLVTIRRPIRDLIKQTRRIATEPAAGTVIEQPGTLEFQELSEAFASMATTLQEREEYITTFARAVSHEFKTPLSSIRGSVELLQDHLDEMDPAERDDFLEVIVKDCDRLGRLVEELLELARADVLRPGTERVVAEETVEQVADDLRTADFSVVVESSAAGAAVPMSREALESLVSNLLGNSREHGGRSAFVEIEADAGRVEMTFSDDGPGIDVDNVDRIFDEFFTTAREDGGTGLGLSIVRTLVEAHDGSVELVDAAPTTFRVRLPRSR